MGKGIKSYTKKLMNVIDSSNAKDKGKRFNKDVIDINNQHILLRIDKNRNGQDDVLILLEIDNQSGIIREKAYCDHVYMGFLAD